MKKIYLIIASFFLLSNSYATDYVVSGSWYEELNGLYVEAGTRDGHPYFVKAAENTMDMEKAIAYGGCWEIGDHFGNGMVMGFEMSCDAGDPPLTGWSGGVTIAPNGPNIKYSGSMIFNELSSNNGSVTGTGFFVHNLLDGQGFAGEIGDDFISKGYVTISNLNEGLQVSVTKISNDTLKLVLSGQAIQHSVDGEFVINFTDNAFSGGGTINGTGGISNTFTINFINEYFVASSGADFNTISAAVAAAGSGDIIHISGETYTESISTDKGLIFKGEGADKTIIQATGSYNSANNRVFTLNSYNDTSEFHRLTIRYGKAEYGGGIYGYKMKIYKCRINNNIALSSSGSQSFGGGIAVQQYFELYDSEVSDNKCDNQNQSGQIMGGGIVCVNNGIDTVKIVNSTFSNNFSRWAGGGVMINLAKIINCTFTNNVANEGSGIYVQYPNSSLVNSIIYGNSTNDVYVLQQPLSSTKSIIGTFTGTINGSPSSSDPLLLPLAFNGGVTQTHSLQEGSPAINSGAASADIPTKDQRGFNKVGTRDIGAFEFGATGQVDIALIENVCAFFVFGEDTLRSSGTFTRTSGDTLYTLNLTIKQPSFGSETISNCGAYTWAANSQTYTQSGTYTAILTNAAGCDSTVTLNLTIKDATTGSETISNCGAYTWAANSQTYTQSGTYTAILTNAAGCDSTVTLNLTILSKSTSTVTASACVSYNWNNKTYTKSGTYWFIGKNTLGCDSIVKLVLTITLSGLPKPTISGPSILCWTSRASYNASVAGGTWSTTDNYMSLISTLGIVRNSQQPPMDMYKSSITYTIYNQDKSCSEVATKNIWIKLTPASSVTINGVSSVQKGKEVTLSSNRKNGIWATRSSLSKYPVSIKKYNSISAKVTGLETTPNPSGTYVIYVVEDTVKKCTNTGLLSFSVTKANALPSVNINQESTHIATTKLSVFPNPTNGKITIENGDAVRTVKLIDMTGKTIMEFIDVNAIDFDGVAPGKYMLKLEGNQLSEIHPIVITQ